MPELCALVAAGALVCLTTATATAVARILLALLQRRRPPTRREALLVALLPPATLPLVLPGSLVPLGDPLHDALHLWMSATAAHTGAHGAIHGANTVLLVLLGARMLRTAYWWAQTQCGARSLRSLARTQVDLDGVRVRVLATDTPYGFTSGALRPHIYLSAGLLEMLEPDHRRAVLAHEQAHIAHRDGLWTLALRSFYSLLPLPGSAPLLAAWEAAAERACDLAAARRVGSACLVAEALVRVGSVSGGAPWIGSPAFGASAGQVETRVEALLAPTPPSPTHTAGPLLPALVLALVSLATAVPILTHLAELFAYH